MCSTPARACEAVQRASNSHYYISRDFYKTLARIRGRFLVSAAPDALLVQHGMRPC